MTKVSNNIRPDSLTGHEQQALQDICREKTAGSLRYIPPLAMEISKSVVIGLA
jgi:hypothetical protein